MEGAKAPPPSVRKVKKNHVKDETDRLKQAEKKKRRLEKALATSAAIRSELEKKKQKKIEEQKRLDEEGAAIAEAVALQVLLGEDSDDYSCNVIVKEDEEYNPWDCCDTSFDLFMEGRRRQSVVPCYSLSGSSSEVNGWVNAHQSGHSYNFWGPYINEGVGWESAEISAANAVSGLQIAEDEHVDAFVYNNMVRG